MDKPPEDIFSNRSIKSGTRKSLGERPKPSSLASKSMRTMGIFFRAALACRPEVLLSPELVW